MQYSSLDLPSSSSHANTTFHTATPVASGLKCGNRASVTYEIKNRLPDKDNNPYPSRNKIYMVVAKTANSNWELTNVILNKVILPDVGMKEDGSCDHRAGVLMDQFKAHSHAGVKANCQSKDWLDVIILPGGLTPVGQPLDKVINKVFKGHFRDKYDQWVLTAKHDEKGCPTYPSRQLLATWVVESWDMIPAEELVRKAWTSCGYPSESELVGSNGTAIVPFREDNEIAAEIEKICGKNARSHFENEEYEDTDPFPSDDEECEDDGTDSNSNDDDKQMDGAEKQGESVGVDLQDAGGCAAGILCGMKGVALHGSHKCLNCAKPMHGNLCGVCMGEGGKDLNLSKSKLSAAGKEKINSTGGALICALCIKKCSA